MKNVAKRHEVQRLKIKHPGHIFPEIITLVTLWADLHTLVYTDISSNLLLESLLSNLHSCPNVQTLELSQITTERILPSLLKHPPRNLVRLKSFRCNLTRRDTEDLRAAIEAGKFPRLQEVDIPLFSLMRSLPQSLQLAHLLPGLEEFDASGKDISNSLHLLTEHVQTSLVRLNVSRCKLTKADIEALGAAIEAGRFPRLQKADVWGNDLSQSLHLVHLLPGLEELDVNGKDISNSLHLLTEHVQTGLLTLKISKCNLTRADIEALVAGIEAGRFRKLQEVDVWGNDLSQSLHLVHLLPGLEELDVCDKDISNSLHLLTEHVQNRLVELDVSSCNLTRADIEALASAIAAGRFPKLQEVDVRGNDLSQSLDLVHLLPGFTEKLNVDAIDQFLPQSLCLVHLLPGLVELDVSGQDISNSLHLLTEHVPISLVKLDVSWCNLTRADIKALAASIEGGRFPKLQEVDVQGNDFSQSLDLVHLFRGLEVLDVSGKDISNSLHLLTDHVQTGLVQLDISRCNLTRADIEALAAGIEAGRFPQLQKVDVRGNNFSQSLELVHLLLGLEELDVSGQDISNSLHLLTEHVQTSLVKLNVSKCNLKGADIEALAAAIEAGRFLKLQSLHLVHLVPGLTQKLNVNFIKQFLPRSLCLVHLLRGLEELDVSGKDISNSLHLLTEHVQTSLVKLYVSRCNLVAADIAALATSLIAGRLSLLQEINLKFNDLDDESVQPLCEALLQYEGPDLSVQSNKGGDRPRLSVALYGNNLSDEFRMQWEEKLEHKLNVWVW